MVHEIGFASNRRRIRMPIRTCINWNDTIPRRILSHNYLMSVKLKKNNIVIPTWQNVHGDPVWPLHENKHSVYFKVERNTLLVIAINDNWVLDEIDGSENVKVNQSKKLEIQLKYYLNATLFSISVLSPPKDSNVTFWKDCH
jgi:hypothetical protein